VIVHKATSGHEIVDGLGEIIGPVPGVDGVVVRGTSRRHPNRLAGRRRRRVHAGSSADRSAHPQSVVTASSLTSGPTTGGAEVTVGGPWSTWGTDGSSCTGRCQGSHNGRVQQATGAPRPDTRAAKTPVTVAGTSGAATANVGPASATPVVVADIHTAARAPARTGRATRKGAATRPSDEGQRTHGGRHLSSCAHGEHSPDPSEQGTEGEWSMVGTSGQVVA
jgi:hypothetical protein